MHRFDLPARHPLAALGLLAVATAPFLWGATRVKISNPLEGWFVSGDPVLEDYRSYTREFGSDEVVLVAIHAPEGVFALPILKKLESISGRISDIPRVTSVFGLSTVPLLMERSGRLEVMPPGTARSVMIGSPAGFRAALRRDVISWRRLVSRDEKTTLLYVMQDIEDDDAVRSAILADIRRILESESSRDLFEHHVSGYGVIYDGVNQASNRDISRIMLPAFIVTALLLLICFGSIVRVTLSILAAAVSMLWALGLFGIVGTPVNLVTTMVPTIVAVISMANAIHLLRDAPHAEGSDSTRSGPATSFSPVFRACLFSTVTTVASFLALAVSDIQVLRELGIFTAAGLAASFVVTTLLCLPLAPRIQKRYPMRVANKIGDWLERRGSSILGRKNAFAALLLAAVVVAVLGCLRLNIDTHSIGFLPREHPVRADSDWLESHYGYYQSIEFELTAEKGAFSEPRVLARIAGFQAALEAHPDLDGVVALTDLFRAGPDEKDPRIPGSADRVKFVVGALRYALGPRTVDRLVGEQYDRTYVAGRVRMQSASGLTRVSNEALDRAREALGSDISVRLVGYLPLYLRLTKYLATSFLKSIPVVLALNFLLLLVLFRSFAWAFIGMPSNILPVLLLLGAMGWLDIPLDVASVSISCIAFGLLVDDTIHLLVRSEHGIRAGSGRRLAIVSALNECGSAIAWTTIVLSGGFSAFMFAEVVPVRYFGSLLSSTLIVGFICDLVLVPILVSIGRRE